MPPPLHVPERRDARCMSGTASSRITAHPSRFLPLARLPIFTAMVARLVPLMIAALLVTGCGGDDPESAAPSPAKQRDALAGSPPPLAGIHAQANDLLGGGRDAFESRLARLRGYPVVVNKWASWCAPCRAEFPYFQTLSVDHGKRIAFLGVNGNDNDGDAREFLRRYPVSFPSYKDPDLKISAAMKAVAAFPSTAFYDSKGELAYVHQGAYATESKLAADIERYAR